MEDPFPAMISAINASMKSLHFILVLEARNMLTALIAEIWPVPLILRQEKCS